MGSVVNQSSSSTSYLPALDGMRAASILLVVVSHLGFGKIVPGGLGVTIFFFISGFIITRLLLSDVIAAIRPDLKAFYLRRFFRLAPALVIFVLFANLAFLWLGRSLPLSDNLAALFYLANYWTIFHGWGGGTPENPYSPLGIVWSLAVEEHFYFLFPFLVVLFRKNLSRLLTVIVVTCILVLGWRIFIIMSDGITSFESVRTYKATDTRIDSILYGCLLSVMVAMQSLAPNGMSDKLLQRLSSNTFVIAGYLLLVATLLVRIPELRETIRYSLQGLALLPIFANLFVAQRQGVIKSILELPVMVTIGKISYSLYLYHWLVVVVMKDIPAMSSTGMMWLVGVPLMFCMSFFSYRFVETPLRHYGHVLSLVMTEKRCLQNDNA